MWSALDYYLILCVPPSIIYNCKSHALPCTVERITVCAGRKAETSQERSLVHHRTAFIHISPLNMQDFLSTKKLQIYAFSQRVMQQCMYVGQASLGRVTYPPEGCLLYPLRCKCRLQWWPKSSLSYFFFSPQLCKQLH